MDRPEVSPIYGIPTCKNSIKSNFLHFARASQRDVKNHSLWMFMDATDSLFVVSS